jgi:hypothetical protein
MSKVVEHKKVTVPKNALVFNEEGPTAINFSQLEGEKKKAEMLVYSGKKMDHWFWGEVIIDVSGISFKTKPYPILEDHSTEKKIGFANKVELDNKVFFPEINLLSNAHAQDFYKNADEGFPYQASISIRPTLVERVEKEESTGVNGMKLKGPLTVFRKSTFREGSVCVFGVDSNAHTDVFSDQSDEIEYEYVSFSESAGTFVSDTTNENSNKEDLTMDLKELKEKHPHLVTEIENAVKEEKDALLSAKDEEIAALNELVTSLSEEKTDSEKRIADLEKREAIRTEKEMKASADGIVREKLGESTIPVRLHEKVSKHFNYSDFVKDGSFDRSEFAKAVADEIKDWEESFGEIKEPLKGVSTRKRDENHSDNVDEDVERLFGYVNVEK